MRWKRRLLVLALGVLGCGSSASGTPGVSPEGGTSEAAADAGEDASYDSAAPPMVIDVPLDKWTWVDFPDSRCGIGSPTGIGVNPHAGATHLLIYLQGGGACLDASTCWGASPTASNMNGYGASDFASDPTVLAAIFQRNNTGNPWNDADLVFVPYCTGDIHIGTAITNYVVNGANKPTYHYGGHNVDLFLASLAATFKGLDRVWISGVSAGGYGSFMNQDFVARAFAPVRVDVLDDSGPAIDDPLINDPTQWAPRLPPGCKACAGFSSVFAYDRTTYPTTRYGLMTYQTDTTLPGFYLETPAAFAQQIQTFVSSLASDPNTKAFVALSSGHVVLEETDATAVPYILPWLTKMATDDPTWATEQH